MDAKEEVRARLAIEDVIGEYVELKRAGRNFKGLSPFSDERTPSFFVSPDKNIWHDFSSNKGGDIFSFVMEMEGIDFRAALEQLAKKANVDLTQFQSAGASQFAARKKRLHEINALAAKFYMASMVKNRSAQEYIFQKRGLDKPTVQEFMIGYAPESGQALTNFLLKRKFSKKDIADAGLANRYGSDLFRGRMMVPLMDQAGQVIGFTGRIIGEVENAPKYLNTPQTLLYDKSRHVFGLSQAKKAIREQDCVVLVEGNIDVVSSHQAGVKNVVATAGTALTEHHLRALSRLTSDVRLGFDGDKAGVAAAERAIGIASTLNLDLTIVSMPQGLQAKDPDELIKRDVELWKKAIDDAEPAVDWLFRQFSSRLDMTSASGKRIFTSAALDVVRRLDDSVERDHYEQKIAELIGSSREAVHEKLTSKTTKKPPLKASKTPIVAAQKIQTDDSRIDSALGIGLIDPATRDAFKPFDIAIFETKAQQAIARYLKNTPKGVYSETPQDLTDYDTYVKIVVLKAETRYASWDSQARYYEVAELLRHVKTEHKKKQKITLQNQLRDAENAGDDAKVAEILGKLSELNKEITRG